MLLLSVYVDCLVVCGLYCTIILICGVLLRVRRLSLVFFFFQAEDGIRDLVLSRGLGDVYKRQDTLDLSLTALS